MGMLHFNNTAPFLKAQNNDPLKDVLQQAMLQNPTADKRQVAESLIRAQSDNIQANFSDDEKLAFDKYKQRHNVSPFRFKELYEQAPKEFQGNRLLESGIYNMLKWGNLLGFKNEKEIQYTEIERLKQNRGQKFLSLENLTDLLIDPANLFGGGAVVNKLKGTFNLGKTALASAGVGAVFSGNELNRDDVSLSDNLKDIALGAAIGGGLGLGIGAGINKIKTGSFSGNVKTPINPSNATASNHSQGIISENTSEIKPSAKEQTSTQQSPTTQQEILNFQRFLDERLYPTNKGVEISEASANNLTQGKGFVVDNPSLTQAVSDYNTGLNLQQWVKNIAGINANKQILADLQTLANK